MVPQVNVRTYPTGCRISIREGDETSGARLVGSLSSGASISLHFLRARPLKTTLIVLGMTLTLFFLEEGVSSTLLFVMQWKESAQKPPLERIYTRYDPDLGWVGIPNVSAADVYGPGKGLRTNSRGFRGADEVDRHVPAGKVRVICLGDSFTLGYGVGNESTWCRLLARRDPHLETVNMGQGGYGLDQDYLWYVRDGAVLDHDILVFAFITEDFRRMQKDKFQGFGKPVLRLEGDAIVAGNVPVPRAGYWFPSFSSNVGLFRSLKTVELADRLLGVSTSATESAPPGNAQTWKVVLRVFEELRRLNAAKGSTLVLLSLPDSADFRVDKSDHWRATLAREAAARDIPFVDLVEEIRKLPPERVPALYNSDFHFNEAGNGWVAEQVEEKLEAMPFFARKLAERTPARAGTSPDTSPRATADHGG
jgi:lysophospholipase L1-like esterase